MGGTIRLPGPVYIEECGLLPCRGDVYRLEQASRERVEVWPPGKQFGDRDSLRLLHYEGRGLHSRETVALCRRVLARTGTALSLVYAHRGYRYEWKTPLLQSLLAMLGPGVHAHGLRVEQDDLPLDLVLLAIGTLDRCERCLIVQDNTPRVGAEEVVAASTMPYLALSTQPGRWAIEAIVVGDDIGDRSSPVPTLTLDQFLTSGNAGTGSLSLTTRTAAGCLSLLRLARPGRRAVALQSEASEPRLPGEVVAVGDPRA